MSLYKLAAIRNIKLYRAVAPGANVLNIFDPKKYNTFKPEGLYLAPNVYSASRWGQALFGPKNFHIHEISVNPNIEVMAAIDGFYSDKGFAKMCDYRTGKLCDVLQNKYIKHGYKKVHYNNKFANKVEVYNVLSNPEIILRQNQLNHIKDIKKLTNYTEQYNKDRQNLIRLKVIV